MASSRYDFLPHHRSDVFDVTLRPKDTDGNPYSLSDFVSAEMMIRTTQDAPDPAEISLTSSGGDITINAETLDLYKTGSAFDISPGEYWYDLQLIDAAGERTTVIYGKFKIIQDVTR